MCATHAMPTWLHVRKLLVLPSYVHVLFITNYVKYITYFKESIIPN